MRVLLGILLMALVSCGSRDVLRVRQFHLQDTEVNRDDYRSTRENQFIRGEINHRVHGAVTAQERNARKGYYYTVSWKHLSGQAPVKVRLEYRQARTGARVKTIEQEFAASQSGKTEFQIIGDAYQMEGEVSAWRILLYEGGKRVAVEESYLWD